MADKKFDCYKCKYREEVEGSCHSRCIHPSLDEPTSHDQLMNIMASVGRVPPTLQNNMELNILGNQRGIDGGWFQFPFNFDPLWLENCDGFVNATNSAGEKKS